MRFKFPKITIYGFALLCVSLSCVKPTESITSGEVISKENSTVSKIPAVNAVVNEPAPNKPLVLWYDKPAFATGQRSPERAWETEKGKYNKGNPDQAWERYGLPVGNGFLGAVTYGGIAKERVQLNDQTIWSGGPGTKGYQSSVKKGTYKYLPEIRRLLLEGKSKEAERLSSKHFKTANANDSNSYPDSFGSYQTWGEFYLEFPIDGDAATNYRRELDISSAISSVEFELDGARHRREIFASYPDRCIVLNFYASEKSKQTFKLTAASPHDLTSRSEGNTLIYSGVQRDNGLRIETRVGVINEGGSLNVTDSSINVENADAVTLVITSATDYAPEPPNYRTGIAPSELTRPQLVAALAKGYDALKATHIADYSNIFGRVSLNIANTAEPNDGRPEKLDPRTTKQAVLLERWENVTGSLEDFKNSAVEAKAPDEVKLLSGLSFSNLGDRYVTRSSAFIVPPEGGEYTFWIAADDFAELALSTDEVETNCKVIAKVSSWTAPDAWDKSPEQKSKPVQLEAGKKYFMRALQQEGGGGDHMSIAWAGPNFERTKIAQEHIELPTLTDAQVSEIEKSNNQTVEDLPTDKRLAKNRGEIDVGLEVLYIQYGRYLLIASSRPGSLPANLQGVWANKVFPPWAADYHLNINLQMNYWPAEMGAMGECALPLIDYIELLSKTGVEVAKEYAGTKGWTAHLHSNIWGYAVPNSSGPMFWRYFPLAGPWLAQHVWDHYDYTRDEVFLREKGYPIMKGSAKFVLGYLSPNNDGELVCSPSWSPEHGPISAGCTADQAMAWDVLNNTADAAKILGDTEMHDRCVTARDQLAPYKIGKFGQLQEWPMDIDNPNDHHRHTNHLFGLHPGRQLSVVGTPKLAEAARVTLNARGDVSTGWSMAWKVNFWARLHDGDRAHTLLSNLLKHGTLQNLWDTHAPFQIDGNFGGTSGAIEMLLQSSAYTKEAGQIVHLLPALPAVWGKGEVKGLRARGAFAVDIKWADGKLITAEVKSLKGNQLSIHYEGVTKTLATKAGESYTFDSNLMQK